MGRRVIEEPTRDQFEDDEAYERAMSAYENYVDRLIDEAWERRHGYRD